MPDDTLSLLPPIQQVKIGKRGMTFAGKIKPAPQPKKPFTMPNVKKVAKFLKGEGKEVTNVTVNGDGGFTVTVDDPAQAEKSSYWHKVLPK